MGARIGPAAEPCGTEHRFAITSSFENVADLAERVSALCGAAPTHDPDLADTVRLCLAEALNNIVEHAYDSAPDRPIFADVRCDGASCEIVLIDEGRPMPGGLAPTGTPEHDLDTLDNLPEGGFGWMLIRAQMDIVDYERREGCNVLRLVKTYAG